LDKSDSKEIHEISDLWKDLKDHVTLNDGSNDAENSSLPQQ